MDAVILWVDSSDPKYIQKKKECIGSKIDKDICNYRIGDRSTLKYCLRGLYFNAPWLRTIYIVTDNQWPKWLDEEKCKKLKPPILRVDHKTINPFKKSMYGSVSIEACLYNIPNLSKYFLYGNDDMFIVRPVEQSLFMNSNGIGIQQTGNIITSDLETSDDPWVKWSNVYQAKLASQMLNVNNFSFYTSTHHMNVYCKTAFHDIQKFYSKLFEDTQLLLGRQNCEQIGLLLMLYVSNIKGYCTKNTSVINSKYLNEHTNYETELIDEDTVLLCTNNIYDPYSHKGYINFMDKLFPNKLSAEITV